MALAMPPPAVPDLQPENYIDLDLLGSADLLTYIWYPGIEEGDTFWPNWRGCGVHGEIVDFFSSLIEVDDTLVSEGMPLLIGNGMLQALDQGWVFYSYEIEDSSQPDGRGEESLRRFFYVGKRAGSSTLLPVPQCKESHDLHLDPDLLVDNVFIVTLPYRAMLPGDEVKLSLVRFFGEGDPYDDLVLKKTLTDADVKQPLHWTIDANELLIIEGGYAEMSYSIEYATPTSTTVSAMQTIRIVKPSPPLLPALRIKDFSGDSLDPSAYPNGITLQIELYPGIQSGDDVVVYATSDSKLVKTLRVDSSTLASEVLQFTLDAAWLMDNNGKALELIYQYARVGVAGTSEPFSVMLRRPLNLPPPIVDGATAESGDPGEHKGYIFASNLTGGVWIGIPADAVIGAGDKVQMHWDGYGAIGSHIAEPSVGDPKQFNIPPQAVPANMGKRVNVYYIVTPAGQAPQSSTRFDLSVRSIDQNLPVIQLMRPRTPDLRLSLARVPAAGAGLDLDSWSFMAKGQKVMIRASGLTQDGDEEFVYLRSGAEEPVTEDEYYDGKLSVIPAP